MAVPPSVGPQRRRRAVAAGPRREVGDSTHAPDNADATDTTDTADTGSSGGIELGEIVVESNDQGNVTGAAAAAFDSAAAATIKAERCRLTTGCPRVIFACFQRLKQKYDEALSNSVFSCSLRRYV